VRRNAAALVNPRWSVQNENSEGKPRASGHADDVR
jgi:hypothetical protein